MKKGALRGRLLLIALVIIFGAWLIAGAAAADEAAGRLARNKEKTVNSIVKSAEGLIKGARTNLAGSYAAYDKLKAQKSETNAAKQNLRNELAAAQKAHQRSEDQLHQTLHELYGMETAQLVIPFIVSLHSKLLEFVQRYKQQAGAALDDETFEYIGGEFKAKRHAMSTIIKSEYVQMQRLRKALQESSDWIALLRRDFSALANNLSDRSAPLGVPHYLSLAVEQFENEQKVLGRVSPFYNGRDLSNRPLLPEKPNSGTTDRLAAFNTELSEICTTAYRAAEWKGFDAWMKGFLFRYDTDHIPGRIEHWTGAYQSKQNIITELKKDIKREMERENWDLARRLDLQRAVLQGEANRLQSETDSVKDRRAQARLIWDAAIMQATWYLTDPTDGAWQRTVKAHSLNLQAVASTYQYPLNAGVKLLQKAALEIPPLLSIDDEQDLKAAFAQAAEKLGSINENGFERLLGQMDAAIEGLQTMSANMVSSPYGMSEAIEYYDAASQLKFEDMRREKDRELPAALAAKKKEVVDMRANFSKSFQFVKDIEKSLIEYERLNITGTALMEELDGLLSSNRYNPIYSKLVDLMLQPYLNHPEYQPIKNLLATRLQDLLKGFSARALPARPVRMAAARKKLAAAVKKEKKSMLKQIGVHINEVSRSYLEQRTLAETLNAAAAATAQITALDDFIKG